jgi:two-component system, NtrC family, sensor histidine kinase HydH
MPLFPTVQIDLLLESALFLSVACFALGIYVASRGPANKLNLAYTGLSLCISLWAFSFVAANLLAWRLMESVHVLSTLALTPLALLFLDMLLRPEGKIFQWMLRLALASSGLLVLPILLGLDRTPWIRDWAFYSPSLIVVANLYLFFSEVLGGVRPRGGWGDFASYSKLEMRNALRRRNFWLYLGGAFVTLLCVMDRVSWLGRSVPALGNILLALYFFFLKDAVLNQSLVSSRRILGKLAVNLAGAVVIFSLFLVLTHWVRNNQILYWINGFFATCVAVAIIDPVRNLVREGYQRWFLAEGRRIEAIAQEIGRELAGATTVDAVFRAVGAFCMATLGVRPRANFHLDTEGRRFVRWQEEQNQAVQASVNGRTLESTPKFFSSIFPFTEFWQKQKRWSPILLSEVKRQLDRETLPTRVAKVELLRETLDLMGATLALPLTVQDRVVGYVVLSMEEPPDHWQDSWSSLLHLEGFFRKAGEAMGELESFARLRDQDRLLALGEMAAGLAHEIRNPLGAIKGAAQVLELKEGDPQGEFIRIIVSEVNRLNEVVTQFLNYAKPFRGEPEWTNLSQVVQGVVRLRRKRAESDGIRLELQDENSPIPLISCQPSLIRLVLDNLLENSHRALCLSKEQKNPSILVRLAHTIRGGLCEISLSVEDNGPGMAAHVLDKIFIPFFTQHPQGTGLGLSICQKIAEAHQGRMEASSVLGQGTLMTLRFVAEVKEI